MSAHRPAPVPDLNWDSTRARAFTDEVVDIWATLLDGLPEMPVARSASADQVREAVTCDIPDAPMAQETLMARLRALALEHATYPGHPRFLAYVTGPGTVPGAAADLLAAAMNQNVGGWRLAPGATEIELHLLRWFAARFGLPDTAGGILSSGGAMANFIALKVARDQKAGFDIEELGARAGPELVLYASTEAHAVIVRAAAMLGLGKRSVRQVPVDRRFRMKVDALQHAIEADLKAGSRPIAVAASAGTTATGSIDPLEDIADLCAQYDLWFHIDGAYGGVAAMVETLKPPFAGIERADSIAFDPHKWLYTPHSGGAVVLRDGRLLKKSFAARPSYVHEDKALTRRGTDLSSYGPQFSRGFQGLKIWVSLLAHGWDAYQQRIEQDVRLAHYLHQQIEQRPHLQTIGPPGLSIVCYRFVPDDLKNGPARKGYLNRLNERLMAELQLDGRVYPSNAVLNGRFVLRACIVNFRTEAPDLDALLDVTVELGTGLDRTMRPEVLR